MSDATLNYVPCPDAQGGHRMAWWQWGAADAGHVIVCVHGLTRQGRDFDTLARCLVAAAPVGAVRVVCPDVVGRGQSDWLKDPQGYQVPTYAGDMLALLAQLHAGAPITTLDWVGTSMGGLIGMAIAGSPSLPLPAPIRRLVLNDVGPAITWSSIQRIASYVGQTGHFETVQQAADMMWGISTSFGAHTPEQWLALSTPMVKPVAGGGFTLHYDPAVGVPIRGITEEAAAQAEAAVWQLYEQITAQTLLLRGAVSDLLTDATATAMTQRGPRARRVDIPGVGHAPTLIVPDQTRIVTEFLLSS